MLIYILFFFSLFFWNKCISEKRKYVIVISVELFLLLALRSPLLGADQVTYSGGYDYISRLSFQEMVSSLRLVRAAKLTKYFVFESGYVVANWLLSRLDFDFQGFLILYAAFVAVSFGRFIDKYSQNPWLSFSLFAAMGWFEYSFGILRQTIATCILLYAVDFMLQKRKLPVILLILTAALFHRASLVFAAVAAAAWLPLNKKGFAAMSLGSVAFLAISPLIYQYVIVPLLVFMGKNSYLEVTFSFNHFAVLMMVIAAALYVTVDFDSLSRMDRLSIYGFFVALLLEIVGMCNAVFARLVYIPFVFILPLIPNTIEKYPNQKIKNAAKPLLYIALFAFYIYQLHDAQITPYIPFWMA